MEKPCNARQRLLNTVSLHAQQPVMTFGSSDSNRFLAAIGHHGPMPPSSKSQSSAQRRSGEKNPSRKNRLVSMAARRRSLRFQAHFGSSSALPIGPSQDPGSAHRPLGRRQLPKVPRTQGFDMLRKLLTAQHKHPFLTEACWRRVLVFDDRTPAIGRASTTNPHMRATRSSALYTSVQGGAGHPPGVPRC